MTNSIHQPGKEFEAQAAIDEERRWLQYSNPNMGALTAHVKAAQRTESKPTEELRGTGRRGFLSRLFG